MPMQKISAIFYTAKTPPKTPYSGRVAKQAKIIAGCCPCWLFVAVDSLVRENLLANESLLSFWQGAVLLVVASGQCPNVPLLVALVLPCQLGFVLWVKGGLVFVVLDYLISHR